MSPEPLIRTLSPDEALAAAPALGEVLLDCVAGGEILGVVQLVPVGIENQPHRAEVAKMLVHRRARRAGVAAALMTRVEVEARRMGRWLLTLDTVTGEAGDRLYRRMGWTHAGDIPDYAVYPDGRLCGTSLFYKTLQSVTGSPEP